MQSRELGRSGLKISMLGLGTMSWGEQNTEAEAHAQLDAALDAGINFVDTAEMYPVPPRVETHGLTERYIGSWIRKSGRRQDVVLATKAAGPARAGKAYLPYVRDGRVSYTRANLFEAVDASLQRLQTDYIDLYQLHWPDRSTNVFQSIDHQYELDDDTVPILETLEALDALVKSGRVRHIGLCNETPWGLARFLHYADSWGLARVISMQNPYNLLNLDFENGLAEMALREQVGHLTYSPLAMGTLTGKYLGGQRPTGSRLNLFGRFFRYSSERAQSRGTRIYDALPGTWHRSGARRVAIRQKPAVCCKHPGRRHLRAATAAQHRQRGSQPVARSPGWNPIDLSALWNAVAMNRVSASSFKVTPPVGPVTVFENCHKRHAG